MSPFNARPLVIAQVKEDRETVSSFFRTYLDPEIHHLTHYTSDPGWERGKEFCLWSPRGRQAVKEEECEVIKVEGEVVIKNPLRLCQAIEEREQEVERQEEAGESRREEVSRKRKRPVPRNLLPQSEATQRLEAFKWMLEKGKLGGLQVEEDHSISVNCQDLFCDHVVEDDGTCSVLKPTQTKLKLAFETFECLIKK